MTKNLLKLENYRIVKSNNKTVIYDQYQNIVLTGDKQIFDLLSEIDDIPKFKNVLQIPRKNCLNSFNIYDVIFAIDKNIGYTIEIEKSFFRMKKFNEYKRIRHNIEIIGKYEEFKFDLEKNSLIIDDFLDTNEIYIGFKNIDEYFNLAKKLDQKNIKWCDDTPLLAYTPDYNADRDIIFVVGKNDNGLMFHNDTWLSLYYQNSFDVYAEESNKILVRLYHFEGLL